MQHNLCFSHQYQMWTSDTTSIRAIICIIVIWLFSFITTTIVIMVWDCDENNLVKYQKRLEIERVWTGKIWSEFCTWWCRLKYVWSASPLYYLHKTTNKLGNCGSDNIWTQGHFSAAWANIWLLLQCRVMWRSVQQVGQWACAPARWHL